MHDSVIVFLEIGELLTLSGAAAKDGRHVIEEDLGLIKDAAIVCESGRVRWVGPRNQLKKEWAGAKTVSLAGASVIPGLVECHTHSVFAGDRSREFEWRMQGRTYQEIAAQGGGILSTVKATRLAAEAELERLARTRVQRFVRQGVTLMETKTGYGLDSETELKCLRVARRHYELPVISTYLGAHSRSPDFANLDEYMQFMLGEMLPLIAREKLADRVDIYIEKGFYDLNLARAYFEKARALGLPICAHVEQLSDTSGTALALEYGAQSVDHVVYLSDAAITRVAKAKSTAVLLPTSDFYLKMKYPPARALIDRGARVALSTDYNPGTSPTQDVSFTGVLARVEMKMSLPEVLSAYTVGAASALGRASESGSLDLGKWCDFIVLDCSWQELFYAVGFHPVRRSVVRGQEVFST